MTDITDNNSRVVRWSTATAAASEKTTEMENGERGGREEQTALEQEIAQLRTATNICTNLRPVDGPSREWLARHFPSYRHSEGIDQLPGRFCITLTSIPLGPSSSAAARKLRRYGWASAITSGYALIACFTLITTTTTALLLIHQWSVPLDTNNPVPDTKLNLTSNRQQLRLGLPVVDPSFC